MPTLEWIGKEKVINHHLDVPFHVLERQYSFDAEGKHTEDNGSENMIIHGDNLTALKSLLPKYEGKINCIYIDPPYNTGNEKWVYNDNVNDPRIKKWLGEVVGTEGEDLSRHDKWLCMMYPRLRLLHKLLATDGAIFISIDDNEQANLKLICDEIFGRNNFVANIAVVNNLKGRSDDKYVATAHENLLIYKKEKFITNGVKIPDEYEKEYKEHDEYGRYRLLGLRKRGSNSKQIDRPNLFYPVFYDKTTGRISLERMNETDIEIVPKLSTGENGNWRWGRQTFMERMNEIVVSLVKGRNEYDLFQKDYLPGDGKKKIKPKSIWIGTEFAAEAGTLQIKAILGKGIFQTPKSTGMIEYCLEQATNSRSIVLDSFAGSGTTAHAVLNLNKQDGGNRKFILVELMDYADSITAERVKRVIKGYGEDNKAVEGTGGDFSFYELGEQLMKDGVLNEAVGTDKIREYIYYTETKQKSENRADEPYYLGSCAGTAYYFNYIPNEVTRLDDAFLSTIKTTAERYVVYADVCTLSKTELEKYNITFKKIPRDIEEI